VATVIALSTLTAFVELAHEKVPFRGKRTLRDNNVVQSQLAQAEARLRAARTFLYQSLDEITDGRAVGPPRPGAAVRSTSR
jgi:alkylation response protein AidB-like acyl-CoA dehydrogenase